MKTPKSIFSIITAIAASAFTLSSCNALWDTDVSYGEPYYGNGYYGWNGEWLPTLAGTPVISPYYFGGASFPIGNYRPVFRPGDNPWGGPATVSPVRPVTPPNGSIGNIRPGQPLNNGPSILKPAPGASTFPNIKESNPGIRLFFHNYSPPEF